MEDRPGASASHEMDFDHSGAGDETTNEISMAMAADCQDGAQQEKKGGDSDLPSGPTDYSLFSNPPNIGLIRQRLFDIDDTLEFSPEDFAIYWPFVDNIWGKCRTGAPTKEKGLVTEWYWCRLRKSSAQRPHVSKPTPEGKRSRNKRLREDVACGMSLKVVHDEGVIKSCRIVRGVDEGMKHTHDLDYLDGIKRNSAIMFTARKEAVKGYLPSSIFAKMWEEPEKMNEAGGKFMKVSDVRNVQYGWRQENPNAVLRAHTGFSGKFTGPRQKTVRIVGVPPELDSKPPNPDVDTPMKLPVNTLRYPGHAREFLEPYLPSAHGQSISPRTTPHITLTYASSLDGHISLAPGLQTALSGPESKAMTHYLRSRHDAILIGVRTAIADDPSLNCRLEGAGGYGGIGWSQQPRPIIIDPRARLQVRPEMKMLKIVAEGRARAPWIVVAPGARLLPAAVSTLKAHGGEYLMVHDYRPEGPGLNWEGMFGILFNEGIQSIMVEGGGLVLSELLKAQYSHLIDSVIITIAPTFLGKAGVQVSPDPTSDEQGRPVATRLTNIKWQPMGVEDVIMCGTFGKKQSVTQNNGVLPGIEDFSQDIGELVEARVPAGSGEISGNVAIGDVNTIHPPQ